MVETNWYKQPGVYFIVDGAFGSTGKGAAAAWLYKHSGYKPQFYTTNSSPNAGHTAIWKGRKIITRHLSVGGIIDHLEGGDALTYLNAGAIIDPDILRDEIEEFNLWGKVFWSPRSTRILPRHKKNHDSLAKIASTQKGTGPAMAERLLRLPETIMGGVFGVELAFKDAIISCEVPQGFSLGLHSGFFPYTTNRECTVMQAASDLGCSWNDVRKVMMTIRTYPIRVGSTPEGFSGPCYPDQEEITWEQLGVTPEMTTVTKRVRRVFTFSWEQYRQALRANQPHALWVGFMDYIKDPNIAEKFTNQLIRTYAQEVDHPLELMVLNYGPNPEDGAIYEV